MNAQEWLALFSKYPWLWVAAAVPAVPFSVWSGRRLFEDWTGFLEALRFWFQPQWLSALRGEFWEDTKAEFKFFFWIVGCLIVAVLGKLIFTKLAIMFSLAERLAG